VSDFDFEVGSLEDAVLAAYGAAEWLSGVDAGVMRLALEYARVIDSEGVKGLWLGAHLQRSLESMRLTPESRRVGVSGEAAAAVDELAEMRSKRGA